MRRLISTGQIAFSAIGLKIVDLFFTKFTLTHFPAKEANPVMRTLFGWMGMDLALWITFLIYSAIIYHMYVKDKRVYLGIVNLIMFIVVANNWFVIMSMMNGAP